MTRMYKRGTFRISSLVYSEQLIIIIMSCHYFSSDWLVLSTVQELSHSVAYGHIGNELIQRVLLLLMPAIWSRGRNPVHLCVTVLCVDFCHLFWYFRKSFRVPTHPWIFSSIFKALKILENRFGAWKSLSLSFYTVSQKKPDPCYIFK